MAVGTPISEERQTAQATYPADLQTVGDHLSGNVEAGGPWLAKPAGATHIKLQVLTQNLRYRIDNGQATATLGFQLAAGSDSLIPISNRGISLAWEVAGAIYQAQWVR